MAKNKPLTVNYLDDELVISIGSNTLIELVAQLGGINEFKKVGNVDLFVHQMVTELTSQCGDDINLIEDMLNEAAIMVCCANSNALVPYGSTNVRYDLPQDEVQQSVRNKIDTYELARITIKERAEATWASYQRDKEHYPAYKLQEVWRKAPSHPSYVDPMIDDWIKREGTYYAKVRVIELLSSPNPKRFILVYGEANDNTVTHGTGPFASVTEAKFYFKNGGR